MRKGRKDRWGRGKSANRTREKRERTDTMGRRGREATKRMKGVIEEEMSKALINLKETILEENNGRVEKGLVTIGPAQIKRGKEEVRWGAEFGVKATQLQAVG